MRFVARAGPFVAESCTRLVPELVPRLVPARKICWHDLTFNSRSYSLTNSRSCSRRRISRLVADGGRRRRSGRRHWFACRQRDWRESLVVSLNVSPVAESSAHARSGKSPGIPTPKTNVIFVTRDSGGVNGQEHTRSETAGYERKMLRPAEICRVAGLNKAV
jgi:hypothetical protein